MSTLSDALTARASQASVRRSARSARAGSVTMAAAVLVLAVLPFVVFSSVTDSLVNLFVLIALASMWNLLAGFAGLVSVGVSTLWLHPDWRPTVAVVLAASGAVLLAVTMLPTAPSVRRGRLGDVAESVALLALLPTLVVAVGVFSAIRG